MTVRLVVSRPGPATAATAASPSAAASQYGRRIRGGFRKAARAISSGTSANHVTQPTRS